MLKTTLVEEQSVEIQARGIADDYLTRVLGSEYGTGGVTKEQNRWFFLICYNSSVHQSWFVGRVVVDIAMGLVIPLTADQIQEISECAAWELARFRGELARTQNGYVSRHQARRLARRWLDQHLSMKFGANGGFLIPLNPPIWQFSIYFALENVHLEPLGVIDVDAQTGSVKPLSDDQLNNLRERVNAVIEHQTSTTAI